MFPTWRHITYALLTRPPLGLLPARLACVRPAASVRSEPGSNSPVWYPGPLPVAKRGSNSNLYLNVRNCYQFFKDRTSAPFRSRPRRTSSSGVRLLSRGRGAVKAFLPLFSTTQRFGRAVVEAPTDYGLRPGASRREARSASSRGGVPAKFSPFPPRSRDFEFFRFGPSRRGPEPLNGPGSTRGGS